jgi:tetratricopeptide (TPR) repeat protein/serine/threonine protein kinase
MTALAERAKSVFLQAVEMVSTEERRALLDAACGEDAALRREVEELLRHHGHLGEFLEAPAAAQPGTSAFESAKSPAARGGNDALVGTGTVIGPYKLLQEIGEGGMGTVFLAQQTAPVKRLVALKVIKPGMDSRQVLARFEAERQALALMDHPHIAKVHDGGTTQGGRPYFVMELVKGVPITKFCDERRLTPRQRLELFVPVCQAVQHAHQKGIIHRDVKPSNVLVALYDGRPVPKVIDFGIAKATGQQLTDKTLVTGFGSVVGTLEYMSPEQAELNQLDIDTRSDIYSLGVLLYELLTGSTPLERKRLKQAGMLEMLRLIREEEPPKPSTRLSTTEELPSVAANRGLEPKKLSGLVRGELDWIVMRALDKDRNRRYETANGFAMDVRRYLADEPVLACPPSAGYRLRKFARRNKGRLAVAGLILFFVAVVGSGGGWVLRDREAREQAAAQERRDREQQLAMHVEFILDDVDRLEREQKWPEAQAAAERAEAALVAGDVGDAIRRRVADVRRDLAFVARLDRIRHERIATVDGGWNNAGVSRDYALAFHDYGLDVGSLPAGEAVAPLRAKPALAAPVAAALDDWISARQELFEDASTWKPLVAAACALDPDPLRNQLRAVWGREVTAELQAEMQRLAESIDVKTQSPVTLRALAKALLVAAHLPDAALRILRDGQYANPADFWLNNDLGWVSLVLKDYAIAARYFTAAVSLRPDSGVAHTHLGNALWHQGKRDEAVVQWRKAIELDPKLALAHANLGNALWHQGKWDEAVVELRKAIELDPKLASAHVNLGLALSHQGKWDEAVVQWRKAVELDPKLAPAEVAMAHNNLGTALQRQGNLAAAVTEYRTAIALDPKCARAHANLGLALYEQKKPNEAIAEYRKAIELEPKEAKAHDNLGLALSDQGRLDEAVDEHRKAIQLDPKLANPHINLGTALYKQKKLDEAVAEYRQAIQLDPTNAGVHLNLGVALYDQKKLDEAVAEYRQAIALDPKFAQAQWRLGVALHNQKKADEAIACFREAIEGDPTFAPAYSSLGRALREQGRQDEAFLYFKKAVVAAPNDAGAHLDLGAFLGDSKHDYDGAITEFEKAIVLVPNHAIAHSHLGDARRAKGDLEGAVAAYRKAVALDSTLADAHHGLGLALCTQRKLAEAIACFRKAIEWEPNTAMFHYNLGVTLYEDKKSAQAIACYRKAIDLKPDYAAPHCNLGYCLQQLGEFREGLAELRRGHELGSRDPHWAIPSARYVRECERLVELDERLPGFLEGKAAPASAGERIELAGLCSLKRLHRAAARFYEEAFAAEPKLAEDLVAAHRYNAACAAALAAAGQGKDADRLDENAKARLRGQALGWLRADLLLRGKQLASGKAADRAEVQARLRDWLADADLAGVRGPEALAKLPEDERQPWQKLWNDAADLLKRAQGQAAPEKKADTK